MAPRGTQAQAPVDLNNIAGLNPEQNQQIQQIFEIYRQKAVDERAAAAREHALEIECIQRESEARIAAITAAAAAAPPPAPAHAVLLTIGGIVWDNQCLCDLRVENPQYDKERIEDNTNKLVQESFVWILDDAGFKDWRDNPHTKLLWIKGDRGKGKTMLMIGLIDELSRQLESRPESEILAYSFCQVSDDELRSATSVLKGIIYLMAITKRNLIRHIRKHYDVSKKEGLFEGDNAWYALSAIFTDMLDDPSLERVYLMVDALDQCGSGKLLLLRLISASSSRWSKVKWLVSSRNEPDIEEELRMDSSRAEISLELNSYYISRAVDAFIVSRVEELAKRKGYKDDISDKVRNHLFAKAEGTFRRVALMCKALDTVRARRPLSVLENFPSPDQTKPFCLSGGDSE